MRLPLTITREGFGHLFVLAFVLAVAMLRELNLLYVVAGLMIGPLVFNGAMAFWMPTGLRLRRSLPRAIEAGETLVANLSLANPRRRLGAWLIVIEDTIERHRAPLRQRRVTATAWFPHVAAGATRHASYRGQLTERGRYRFGPLRLTCRFPLGLVRRTITRGDPDEVVVYPRLFQLTAPARALWRHALDGPRHARRRGRAETEYHGLRDWQRGDSQRWIHWRSTARHGELIVREFEHLEHHDLAIVLDLRQSGRPTRGSVEIVERAVSIAATFAAEACRQVGARVTLAAAAAGTLNVSGVASPALYDEMLASLAEIEAALTNTPGEQRRHDEQLARQLEFVAAEARANTPVVLVSSRAAGGEFRSASALGRASHRWTAINAADDSWRQYVTLDGSPFALRSVGPKVRREE